MKPLVSIVTLTYKKFDLIYNTIQSVIDQDYPRIELIISDDGSGNFPYEKIVSFLDANKSDNLDYKILISDSNQGTVRNINKAYKTAAGKYIINLSADDTFYCSDVISRIVDDMEMKGYDLLITSRMVCSESGEFIGFLPKKKNIKRIEKLNTAYLQHRAFMTGEYYNMASGSALCVKNETIKNMGYYDERYVLWEDGPLFMRYTKQGVIGTDFDIISVRYCLGGVSNSGMNPRMIADYKLYNATDRCEDIGKYNAVTQMKVRYIKERDSADTRIKKYMLYLKYPLVMMLKSVYRIRAH